MSVDLRLYGILDTQRCGTDPAMLADKALAAIRGGCTLIQYRDKTSGIRAMIERARHLREAIAGAVPFLVNDRVDVALASGADGVHLGQDDMRAADARGLLGPHAILGLTLKTATQADDLYRAPIDYACIGGVFATASKDNPDRPVGLDGLTRILFRARLARGRAIPVGAIAGIDAGNAGAVMRAGADGIAVISSLFLAPDIEAAARALRVVVDAA